VFSNTGVDVWKLFASWAPFVIGSRPEIVVALDWTEFDADNQSTIALHLVTKHGRATPLHRGFGDRALYELFKDQLGFDFVVRFRGVVKVADEHGVTKTAAEWVPENGRPRLLPKARVTSTRREAGAVVGVKGQGDGGALVPCQQLHGQGWRTEKLYGKRFTIEETFRDIKNLRFGMGLSATRISSTDRRERILLVGAKASSLLMLLGAAGEAIGSDMMMKANTVKTRTHSLLNQGLFYFEWLATMDEDRARPLVTKYDELIREQATLREVFGLV